MIRKAIPEDFNEIYLINKNSLGYEYPLEKTKENLSEFLKKSDHIIFVYTVDEKSVGYIHLQEYQTVYSDKYYNCLGLAVLDEYKRRGIGKALLTEAEKQAKLNGAVGVRLNSGASRVSAHEFYKSCGYEDTKTQKNFKKIL